MSLFAWNSLFGGVGGLLLCLHENFDLHPELGAGDATDCGSAEEDGGSEAACLSKSESCVDIAIDAVQLPSRIDEVQSLPVFSALHVETAEVTAPSFTLKEIAHIVQAQAPPELLDTSVLIAQTVNLRL